MAAWLIGAVVIAEIPVLRTTWIDVWALILVAFVVAAIVPAATIIATTVVATATWTVVVTAR